MIRLEGSCHCGAVRFSVASRTPVPYMHCYCSICRKTAGGAGAAINIMGQAETLEVTGEADIAVYRAHGAGDEPEALSEAQRHFCKVCGSALFIRDPRWPEWVYPHASAIDTPLPPPRERAHIMLAFKPDWMHVPSGDHEIRFEGYPDQPIEDWHRARGLLED